VYLDYKGNPTTGWGCLLSAAEFARMPVGTPITLAQAEAWFARMAAPIDARIDSLGVPLNENQLAALESLLWNNGVETIGHAAPLLTAALKRQDWPAAAHEFLDICHATDRRTGQKTVDKNLKKRRLAESELFRTPVKPEPIEPEQVLFAVGLSLHDMVRAIDMTPHHLDTADTEPAPPPEFLPEDV